MARAMAAVYTGDYEGTVRCAQAAVKAAEANGDEFAAIVASGISADGLPQVAGIEKARRTAAGALARAERPGNPALIAIEAICMAASYTMTEREPDFAGGLDLLTRYANDFGSADITTLWSRLIRGYCIISLGDPGAAVHLIDAVRLADRLNAPHAVDMALRALALHSATSGYLDQAARLVGYAEGSLSVNRVDNLMWMHVEARLDEAMRGHDEIGPAREEGARLKRRDILALVADLETRFAD
jgi:hypothetical protein